MVKLYTEDDFIKLFNLCNKVLNEMGTREYWKFETIIRFILDGIRENKQQFILDIRIVIEYYCVNRNKYTKCPCLIKGVIGKRYR